MPDITDNVKQPVVEANNLPATGSETTAQDTTDTTAKLDTTINETITTGDVDSASSILADIVKDEAAKDVKPVATAPVAPVVEVAPAAPIVAPAPVMPKITKHKIAPAPVVEEVAGEKFVSVAQQQILSSIDTYIAKMDAGKKLSDADINAQQVSLFRQITAIINNLPAADFDDTWKRLLARVHAAKDGAFSPRRVFRGFDNMTLGEDDRTAFQRLLNLVTFTADPKGRALAIKQIDFNKTFEFGLREAGRQRALYFYGQ